MTACEQVLGAGMDGKQRALLRLALSYFTWRTLVHDGDLDQNAAVMAMARAIECSAGA